MNYPDEFENIEIEERLILSNGGIRTRKYKTGKFLGKGGFAKCYEFLNIETNHISAAKIIPKKTLYKARAKQKLINEIKIHKSTHNPHIVEFEHYFEDSNNVYILLEMCHNQSMNELLRRRKRLTNIEVQCYILQLIKALKYLHNNKIIHRDVKLGNLFLTNEMQLKLGDFGLAAKIESNDERRRTICGTPNYIAPEILQSKVGHSYEVDIWAVGVILYTLLIGNPPFETQNLKNTYEKILNCDYNFPNEINISNTAKILIIDILQVDPSKRPTLSQIENYDYLMGLVPIILPSSTIASSPSQSYINMFSQEPPENSIFCEEPIWVKNWIDYTSKYGLAYILTNGTIGVYFNDSTKLLLDNDEKKFNYIYTKDKQEVINNYSYDSFPESINKKVSLLYHFKKYLKKEKSTIISSTEYVKKWARTRHCILFRLSNKIIQVSFNDNTKLIINSINKTIIYFDQFEKKTRYPLLKALESNNTDMTKRLRYTAEILNFLTNKVNDENISITNKNFDKLNISHNLKDEIVDNNLKPAIEKF